MVSEANTNLYRTKKYIDSSLSGQNDSTGQTKQYYNNDAIANALKIWLAMPQFGKVNSTAGGYILPQIKKPMTEDRASFIKDRISAGLSSEFSPAVKTENIQVLADLKNRKWIITIVGYIPSLNQDINTTLLLNN